MSFRHVIQARGTKPGESCTLVCQMSGTSIDLIPFGDPRCGVRLTTEDARSLAQALLEATGDEPVFTNDEGRRVAWRLLKLCGGS